MLLVLLASALGVYDPDADDAPPEPAAIARHAPLPVAELLAATGRPLAGYLSAAFAEVAREAPCPSRDQAIRHVRISPPRLVWPTSG